MNKITGISLALILLPFYVFAQDSESIVLILFKYGVLPFSLFISALIASSIYSYKDKRDEKTILRIVAWILTAMNTFLGFKWLFMFLGGLYSLITGEPEMGFQKLIILSTFVFGGFMPLYIMIRAELRFKKSG